MQKGAEQEFNILEAQRQQSLRELKYLNSCRHDNILSLYGFSIGGEKPCLVYQYMVNGSLEDRLQCRVSFNYMINIDYTYLLFLIKCQLSNSSLKLYNYRLFTFKF